MSCSSFGSINDSLNVKVFREVLSCSLIRTVRQVRTQCLEPLSPVFEFTKCVPHDFTGR